MFCGITEVEQILMIEISTAEQVLACERAIDEATEAIRNYTNQYISKVSEEEIILDGTGRTKINLTELPIISIDLVEEDDEVLVSPDDYKLGQFGIIHRMGGNIWSEGIQNIVIKYTHGYQTIPEDIKAVCTRAASRIYQASLRSSDQNGIPGVSGFTIGDYSVNFASEQGGGLGEGLSGVSSSRFLLRHEKEILNRYRYRNIGPL